MIYSENAARELSPRELLKRGRELADAVETMEDEYHCSKCKKSIDDEINPLIIDKVSKSKNTEEYFALCPECLKNIEAEASE